MARRKTKSLRLRRVEVTWSDIASYGGWRNKEEMVACVPAICQSVGYLISRDRKLVKIAMSYNDFEFGSVKVIPRANVRTIKKI